MSEQVKPTPAEIAHQFSKSDPKETEIRQAQRPFVLHRQRANSHLAFAVVTALSVGVAVALSWAAYNSKDLSLQPGEQRAEAVYSESNFPEQTGRGELSDFIDNLFRQVEGPRKPYDLP